MASANKGKRFWGKILAVVIALALLGGIFIVSFMQMRPQIEQAKVLKSNAQRLVSCVMKQNPDGAQRCLEQIKQTTREMQLFFGNVGFPIRTEARAVQDLLSILDSAAEDLIQPGIDVLREHPMGISEKEDALALQAYLDFADSAIPKADELVTAANNIKLGMLNIGGFASELLDSAKTITGTAERCRSELLPQLRQLMQEYPINTIKRGDSINVTVASRYLDYVLDNLPQIRQALTEIRGLTLPGAPYEAVWNDVDLIMKLYDENQDLVTVLRGALGHGETKAFVLVAMNSTEIRALGGFPGSVGVVQIQDGMLTIGDFQSVYNLFPGEVPWQAGITTEERELFSSSVGSIARTWDACLCPDFERVAEIWAASFANQNGIPVEGVIAMTPTIIQKLLTLTGTGFELSDGTWLDGTNATRTLERDLYFRYFGRDTYNWSSNRVSDELFAETAKKAMEAVFTSLRPAAIPSYLELAQECFDDRTAMIWMQNEEFQKIIRARGWDGGLTRDPMVPEAGIYFNCTIASKMGWFAKIDTEVGKPTENADNSRTYPVTVTLTNTITPEEIAEASNVYILGGGEGSFDCSLYLFAPAGGSVSDFSINIDAVIGEYEYKGLQLGYLRYAKLHPGKPIVITYNVTTAPGADTPLTISQTPTLQEYH